MKVVNLCVDDWANFMYAQNKSLVENNVNSVAYKINKHLFNYDNQCPIITTDDIGILTKDATHVILHHSDYELAKYVSNGKIFIYHTGTKFRQNSNNIIAHTQGYKHLYALPEFKPLLDYSNIKAGYVIGAIDWLELMHYNDISTPYVVSHYPSNPDVKGSETIIESVKELNRNDFNFIYSLGRTDYKSHINRLKSCDIYIELLASSQGGKPYGSFGMTALEAASLGKIVITNNLTGVALYEQEYGSCPLIYANNKEQLKFELNKLLNTNVTEITFLSHRFRQWAKQKHGFEPTGKRLLRFLYEL